MKRAGLEHEGRWPFEQDAPCRVCMACFTAQERYTMPFAVWCTHTETVVHVIGKRRYRSWPLTGEQLVTLLEQLYSQQEER